MQALGTIFIAAVIAILLLAFLVGIVKVCIRTGERLPTKWPKKKPVKATLGSSGGADPMSTPFIAQPAGMLMIGVATGIW